MKSVVFSIIGKSKRSIRNKIISILNDYAINIDCDNSLWCAKISMDGIEQVKNKLSMLVTKNISVICMDGDNIIFRVGKKQKSPMFDYDVKDVMNYFDVLQFICVLASAFHDIGKFNDFFQSKLKNPKPLADPFRHEYVSCKIIEALVNLNHKWYNDFLLNRISISSVEHYFQSQFDNNTIHMIHTENFSVVEKLICYLILSHHRLPTPNITLTTDISNYLNFDNAIQELSKDDFGYNNTNVSSDLKERQEECFVFSRGISLIHTDAIDKEFSRDLITRISKQLNNFNKVKNKLTKLIENPQNVHLLVHIARNVLMLADHKFSSTSSINIDTERNMSICYANTKEQFSENKNKYIKVYNQTLLEHLYGVSKTAEEILQWIPFFKDKMPYITNKYIQEKTDETSQYYWQQKVCNVIKKERANNKVFFICNMASTGKGKTIANAKMMNAISNRLRYNLCVGLTTLVEQTTKSYKQIGFNEENLCMCIGADEKEELHKIFDSDDFNKSEYDLDSISSSNDLLYKQNYGAEFHPSQLFVNDTVKNSSEKPPKAYYKFNNGGVGLTSVSIGCALKTIDIWFVDFSTKDEDFFANAVRAYGQNVNRRIANRYDKKDKTIDSNGNEFEFNIDFYSLMKEIIMGTRPLSDFGKHANFFFAMLVFGGLFSLGKTEKNANKEKEKKSKKKKDTVDSTKVVQQK
jgi:hypothetical protein